MVSSKGVQRFLDHTPGLDFDIREMAETTHTAQEAADAVGCPVAAIVKSLVFAIDGEPVLLLVSGPSRVNVDAVAARLGVSLGKADADQVKTVTGYSIGGVPPFGHVNPVRTFMDEDLLAIDELWAAAGSANAVFPIAPDRLRELSKAEIINVH
jgi:prolyl-tRNA editing enzyme YbaK/EbsC (Cys-tRNA(Pro) deacylase)